MIMVAIQAAHGDALPVSLQLPSHITVFAAVVRLDRKTTVSPQLALGTETVRHLQQRHQQSGTNRADRRNLAATSRQDACDSCSADRVALPGAPVAADPVADTTVPLAGELRAAGSWPTTPRDAAGHRRSHRYTEWPSFDREL